MTLQRLFAIAGTAVAAGCSTVPSQPNQALLDARETYRTAAADAHAVRTAPDELANARSNLQLAESAWQKGAAPATVEHLAYLANQQALIALERGKLALAEQTIETASAERNEALLDSQRRQLASERDRLALAQRRAEAAEGVAAAQAERNAELQKELQQLAAKQTPLGMVITLDDVLFDTGKATLKPGAQRALDRLAEFMQRYPERKVRVEGFTDDTGSAEANQSLSQERAAAVRDQLVRRGIAPERVEAVGYGPAFPVASNSTPAGRQQNRRVEVVISDAAGNVTRR